MGSKEGVSIPSQKELNLVYSAPLRRARTA
ncbi:uncharacterized protein METZ01_LOCUS414549, partial [marine metagenome]